MAIQFTLNGKAQSVDVDPQMPLLWVLRDTLNLTGTKFGCGMALCGACTVHIDGEATRSCITPVSEVAGKKVTTIEGLSADLSHPVQKAWIELDVPQCGYCQSGQIMSAAALLAKKPQPTDAEVDDAMSGNICRCGTYQRIRAAMHRAAQMHAAPTRQKASPEKKAKTPGETAARGHRMSRPLWARLQEARNEQRDDESGSPGIFEGCGGRSDRAGDWILSAESARGARGGCG